MVGGVPRGESFALKDCWVDDERAVEGDTLLKILSGCTDEERSFFLTLEAHGTVEVDDAGTKDNTKTVMMRGFDVYQPKEEIISAERASSRLPQSSAFMPNARVQQEDKQYTWKNHYRIIFKEVGISMYEIRSLQDAFQALIDMTKALEIMAKKDYVHRDISGGNILFYQGRGKLCDLEYAITPDAQAKNVYNMCMGTLDFMPVEVYTQTYLILPSAVSEGTLDIHARVLEYQPKRPIEADVTHTIIHDAESLWWVGVWILFWSTTNGYVLEDVNNQINTAVSLFPHGGVAESGSQRAAVLQSGMKFESYIRQLPSNFFKHGAAMENCRRLLCEAYRTSRIPGEGVKKEARLEILSKFRDHLSGLFSPTIEDSEIQPLLNVQKSLTQLGCKADKHGGLAPNIDVDNKS